MNAIATKQGASGWDLFATTALKDTGVQTAPNSVLGHLVNRAMDMARATLAASARAAATAKVGGTTLLVIAEAVLKDSSATTAHPFVQSLFKPARVVAEAFVRATARAFAIPTSFSPAMAHAESVVKDCIPRNVFRVGSLPLTTSLSPAVATANVQMERMGTERATVTWGSLVTSVKCSAPLLTELCAAITADAIIRLKEPVSVSMVGQQQAPVQIALQIAMDQTAWGIARLAPTVRAATMDFMALAFVSAHRTFGAHCAINHALRSLPHHFLLCSCIYHATVTVLAIKAPDNAAAIRRSNLDISPDFSAKIVLRRTCPHIATFRALWSKTPRQNFLGFATDVATAGTDNATIVFLKLKINFRCVEITAQTLARRLACLRYINATKGIGARTAHTYVPPTTPDTPVQDMVPATRTLASASATPRMVGD